MKKILLLDMDGVLVNFLVHWLSYLDLFYGIVLKPEDVTDWGLHKTPAVKTIQRAYGWTDAQLSEKIYGPFSMPGFWRSAPLMVGARKFIDALAKRRTVNDFEFYIVTSPSGAICAKEKVEYITDIFGNVPYIITRHKHLIQGDMLVDDHPENVYKWIAANPNGRAILPGSPYSLNELLKLPQDNTMASKVTLTEDLMDGDGFASILKTIDEKLGLKL